MYRLSFQIIFLLLSINIFAQSPHGDDFNQDCSLCHSSDSWKVNLSKVNFDHSQTKFKLVGQHQNVNCKSCHTSLVFSSAKTDCFSCHKDIHQGTVGFDCTNCHTPTSWIVKDIIGIHQSGRFPLLGAHKLADCAQCHTGYAELKFDVLNVDCYACHSQDYNSAQSPNHIAAKFSTDCQECHNVNSLSWNTTNVNHSFFPLSGGHAIQDCFACHQQDRYAGLSPECYSCHRPNYEETQNPNHISAGLPTTCEVCHSINGWSPAQFNHNITQFPLTGKHINVNCSNCHTNGYTGTPTECYSCHRQDFESVSDPNHVASQFPTDCSLCHTTSGWEGAIFDHNQSSFPLTGSHVQVACANCHTNGYTGTPTDCFACHQTDYQSTTDPNHVLENYPLDCTVCHNTTSWGDASFDHNTTQFPLTGAHVQVACASCHTNGYTGTPTDCYSCHQQNYQSTTDPDHVLENYPLDCTVCHNTTSWGDASFDHNTTQFPLTGAHVQVACANCHTNGYTGTPTDCYSCHQQNYQSTTDPNHVLENYPLDCTVCHNTTSWGDASFDHNTTQFPLTGAHVQVACASCHTNGYTGTPTDCFACHQTDYNNTSNPNHQAAGFPTTCIDCHSTTAWLPATFDHDAQYFPIYSGSHNNKWTLCSECHTTPNNYSLFSCIDCHEHNRTDTDQEHQGVQGYIYNSADCFACHPDGRSEGAFNHATSSFPLTGAHIQVACASCHTNGYTGTPTDCFVCHQTNYNNTINPNHQALSFSTDCTTCHSTNTDWQPALFPQHNQFFQLLGRHLEIANDCASCHDGNYNNTPNQCVNCHQQNYNNSVNPNHSAAGISTECATCHNVNGWSPSTFDHSATGFTLLGAHQPLQCSSCHIGTTSGLTSDCISCHQSDYNSAPNHTAQLYPTNCELCHNSIAWIQVTFNHQNTNFPLTGAHVGISCQLCHANGYQGTPTECFACHQTDYQQSANPSHTSLVLATTCQTCHTTNAGWAPATFPVHNDFFQLLGAHLQINNCADCHQGNYNNTPNTCIGCHQNDYNGTTDPPHQTLNFSDNCLTCHTMSGWTPATFNHSFFPVGSHHNNVDCNECHSQPNYQPQCLSCHLNDFNDEHDPGDPTDCWNCHSTSNWDADFDHNNTYFPLTGAHQKVDCAQCHKAYQKRMNSECVACHMQDYLSSVNPNHKAMGISTDCASCHSSNNWDSRLKIFDKNKVLE